MNKEEKNENNNSINKNICNKIINNTNNIINTQNFIQINYNNNQLPEFVLINNNIYKNFSPHIINNQNSKLQISQQDIIIINSLYNEIDIQKNQINCRYLQNKIITDPKYSNEILFPFLFQNIVSLINSQYGNLIYQSFIEVLNAKNLFIFLTIIKNNFNEISKSSNGTRVIQKLIEKSIKLNQNGNNIIQKSLIETLKGKITEFSNDENANHIIQKFIIYIPYPNNNFIFEEIYLNFMHIAITKYGCCVIQKCLLSGIKEQKEKIIYLVLQNTFNLIINQFGNYVYQSVILLKDEKINIKIIEIILDKIIILCKEKYSSNVIEKLFDIDNMNIKNQLIDYITNSESKVMELLTNKYGNYIVQKMISICNDKNLFFRILNIIAKNVNTINKISFGKKLIGKLTEKYPILISMINSNNNEIIF